MKTIESRLASELRPCATVSESDLHAQVASHSFCQGLNDELVQRLTDCALRVHFDPDQIIFREGDMANRFYLIERGEIALEATERDAKPTLLQTLGAGDVLGWSWLFPPYYYHFDARALKPTDAIFFYGTRLREVCEENPDLGYELLKRISMILLRRLQAWTQELSEMTPAGGEPLPVPSPQRPDWTYDKSKKLDKLIADHPFFKTISPRHLAAITEAAQEKVFEPGELIVRQKDYANKFFVLEKGNVALEYAVPRDGSVPIQVMGAGDVFGWSWLFPPFTWHFQARALEYTRAVVLNGAKLLILCETNHSLGYELMRRVTEMVIQRLQATRRQVLLLQRRELATDSRS